MGFVLEHEKPLLEFPVHIHVHVDAAGIVLLTDFHVVQKAGLTQIPTSDCRHIHQVQALVLATEFLSHFQVEVQCTVYFLFHEGLPHPDFFKFGGESGVTAMVAPVCVQYAEFSLVRVAAFFREVFHHLTKVIGIHCQTHLAAERLQVLFLHIDKAF